MSKQKKSKQENWASGIKHMGVVTYNIITHIRPSAILRHDNQLSAGFDVGCRFYGTMVRLFMIQEERWSPLETLENKRVVF